MKTLFRVLPLLLVGSLSALAQPAAAPDTTPSAGPTPPPADKTWTADDYAAFKAYLGSISIDRYPRLSDPLSAALFQQLIDSSKQPAFSDPEVPLEAKLIPASRIAQEVSQIMFSYIEANEKGEKLSLELAELSGVALTISAQLAVMVEKELIPTLDPEANDYRARINGLSQMQDGLVMQLEGSVHSLGDENLYSPEERRLLAGYIAREAPAMIAFLDDNRKAGVVAKYKAQIKKEQYPTVKAKLAQAIEAKE